MAWGNAMNKRRILLVDDDAELRATLLDQLSHYREFELAEAGTARDALLKTHESHVDLMLLDVGLPDMDGREAVKILRSEGFKSPIVMLTGQDSDSDEILGLESGANDYVTKPFRFSVLLARIRAALRQHDQSEDVVFSIGPYSFQPAAKLLEAPDGGKVRLTDKETNILKYLYRQGPKTISREVLLKEVWGYNNRVTTHTLETHIYRLRQKIERDPSNARLLVTEEGGYRLVP
jgi:DNA-binding response OmpR family regulator